MSLSIEESLCHFSAVELIVNASEKIGAIDQWGVSPSVFAGEFAHLKICGTALQFLRKHTYIPISTSSMISATFFF